MELLRRQRAASEAITHLRSTGRVALALLGGGLVLATVVPAPAMSSDALDPGRAWRLGSLTIRGAHAVPGRTLRAAMATRTRAWYLPWQSLPPFDPVVLQSDLARLRRVYESHGYYQAHIAADLLPSDDGRVAIVLDVTEGEPVRVTEVTLAISGDHLPGAAATRLPDDLGLATGDVFSEAAYAHGQQAIVTAYREHTYARVRVTRSATVDVATRRAQVAYAVTSGPRCVFGEVRIEGALGVEPAVVEREITFAAGEPFAPAKLEGTRRRLAALRLFRTIELEEDRTTEARVNVYVRIDELPPREVHIGVGYDTDEGIRGLASWRHYDFLGGARQLGLSVRGSQLYRLAVADFVQPHFPWSLTRFDLTLLEERDLEDAYTLDRTRLSPRLQWTIRGDLHAFAFYRAEYDSLSDVPRAVKRAVPEGTPPNSVLSGAGVGAAWTRVDDPLDPSRGGSLTALAEPVGGALGGDIALVRGSIESHVYQPLAARLGLALRLHLGTAAPLGSSTDIPIFERFYAGGINSVRGYGRHEVGPRAANGDPIGGRSLIETSIELRQHIWDSLTLVTFLDAGQVARTTLTFPLQDLSRGTGVGLRYHTPVGPLRVDLAFPLDRRPGDAHWQVHLSVGPGF